MSLISTPLPAPQVRETPRVLHLGEVGSGKTLIFNKITGRQRETRSGGASVTQAAEECTSSQALAPELRMRVVDTPGTSSLGQKLEHAVTLKLAMTSGHYNQIFVFVRFGRDGAVLENLKKQMLIVKDFMTMVTVVVTHFDLCDRNERQANFNSLRAGLNAKFRVQKLLCTERDTLPDALLRAMFAIASSEPQRQITIPDRVFRIYFDITEISWDKEIDLQETKAVFQTELRLHQDLMRRLSKSSNPQETEHQDLIVFTSYSKLVELSQFLCVEFGKAHADVFLENGYAYYLHLKMELNDMIESMVQYYNEMLHQDIRRVANSPYRRCPHCGLIWVKPQGCDGQTTCGNRPDVVDVCHSSFVQVEFRKAATGNQLDIVFVNESSVWDGFKLVNNVVQYKYKTRVVPAKTAPQAYNTNGSKGMGCGKSITWSEMPILSNDEIRAFLAIENTQFYADADQIADAENGFQKRVDELAKKSAIVIVP